MIMFNVIKVNQLGLVYKTKMGITNEIGSYLVDKHLAVYIPSGALKVLNPEQAVVLLQKMLDEGDYEVSGPRLFTQAINILPSAALYAELNGVDLVEVEGE